MLARPGETAATSGAVSWSASDSGGIPGYYYRVDANAYTSLSQATGTTLSGLGSGWHTFNVQARDNAGNYSPVAAFGFGVGVGGLASPADQDRTQAQTTVLATGPTGRDWVTYQYRLGTTAAFTPVPTADASLAGTSTHPAAWPVGRNTGGTFDAYVWTVSSTVSQDGPVQIEACLGSSATEPMSTSPPTTAHCPSAGR